MFATPNRALCGSGVGKAGKMLSGSEQNGGISQIADFRRGKLEKTTFAISGYAGHPQSYPQYCDFLRIASFGGFGGYFGQNGAIPDAAFEASRHTLGRRMGPGQARTARRHVRRLLLNPRSASNVPAHFGNRPTRNDAAPGEGGRRPRPSD